MKNILHLMQGLNFSQYESKAYLTLLKQDNITGYELAKNSGIPASKIYQVLNKLAEKEIVIALDSDPVKYVPIPPKEVLSRIRGDYLQNIDMLSPKLDEVYKNQQNDDNYIWNIQERDAILRRVTEFIGEAEKELLLSVWDEEVEEIGDAIKAAHGRGIKIIIVHYGQQFLGIGDEYRHGREHQIRRQRGARRLSIEIDEEKVILAHFLEDGSSNAVWTTNKGLVLLAKDYIIHDIYTIRFADKFGKEAGEIFKLY